MAALQLLGLLLLAAGSGWELAAAQQSAAQAPGGPAAGDPAAQPFPAGPGITELNIWTFRGSVADGRLWFIQFYVPWCRGCKRMSGQWDALAEEFMRDPQVVIARFDCMTDEAFCESQGVEHTPTLKLYHNGKAVETYRADFYHVDMMRPFLRRMKAQHLAQRPPADLPGPAATATAAAAGATGVERTPLPTPGPTGAGTDPSGADSAQAKKERAGRGLQQEGSKPQEPAPGPTGGAELGAAGSDVRAAELQEAAPLPRVEAHMSTMTDPQAVLSSSPEHGRSQGHEAAGAVEPVAVEVGGDVAGAADGGEAGAGATAAAAEGGASAARVPEVRRGRQGGPAVEALQSDREEL
ncbi:hypothetical protein HYH03_015516 [Edaphochlamys debaryana]|uniref:Thioredoxin domain-containing protein n=1 Tax=Edaphochlamys debaryana TaxID=47281 RepID=A0A835XLU0_9CHLO|nr:hypothetical protein HYH03_015516 [Edaphochlamys debaryana]|eukprot:KAG2485805.1 hypothetical protein HYH03_015516 [Edaphochlamys debaryana]